MKKKLEEIIGKIDAEKSEFYKNAIELHEDKKLREIAGHSDEGFKIIGGKRENDNILYYNEKGFEVSVAHYHCGDDYDSTGHYAYEGHQFEAENNRLVAVYHFKKRELLEIFPKITIEKINAALEKEIKKLDVYKRTGGSK